MADKVGGVNFVKLQTQEEVVALNRQSKAMSRHISNNLGSKRVSANPFASKHASNNLYASSKAGDQSGLLDVTGVYSNRLLDATVLEDEDGDVFS